MPILKQDYYFYQTFWTIPWGLATAIQMAGIAHVVAILGRQKTFASLEGALAVIAISWVIPSFVFLWLPETLFAPFTNPNELPWPVWMDIVRLSVLAPAWQVALTTIGIQVSHKTTFARALVADWTFDNSCQFSNVFALHVIAIHVLHVLLFMVRVYEYDDEVLGT